MARKSARAQRNTTATGHEWWADAVEAPRSGLADANKLGKRQRIYRYYVWGSMLLVPLAVFAVLSSYARATPVAPAPPASQSADASSPGRSAAQTSVNAWLANTPSPLPGGSVLFWEGSHKVAPVIPPASPTGSPAVPEVVPNAPSIEVDSFVLITTSNRMYTADVQVALDPRGGAKTIAGPSLIPIAPVLGDSWASGVGSWQGLKSESPSDVVTQAITAWSRAYISGDSAQIRLAVGDPTPGHAYVPLSGVSSVVPTVTGQAQPGTDPSKVIARVQLSITWAGQPAPTDAGAARSQDPSATFDVLLDKANTASPVVVAWGGPGEGPRLAPYQNAVVDGPRQVPTTTTAAPTTTTAPSTTTAAAPAPPAVVAPPAAPAVPAPPAAPAPPR